MKELNIFGGVLIKSRPVNGQATEKRLKEFLRELSKLVNTEDDPEKLKAFCQKCPHNDVELACDELEIVTCSSLTGFFDFIVTLRVKDIATLEKFVVYCLKGGGRGSMIADTQTLAGAYFYPDFKQQETEQQHIGVETAHPG